MLLGTGRGREGEREVGGEGEGEGVHVRKRITACLEGYNRSDRATGSEKQIFL